MTKTEITISFNKLLYELQNDLQRTAQKGSIPDPAHERVNPINKIIRAFRGTNIGGDKGKAE